MSTMLQPISELDHLTRNPDIAVGIITDFRCSMLEGLANHSISLGCLSYPAMRSIERYLSTLFPFHDNQLIDSIDQSWAKSQRIGIS